MAEPEPRHRVYYWTGAIAAAGCLVTFTSAAFLTLRRTENPLILGIALGSLFGQTGVAAAWTAFGPGPLLIRLPLSLLWVFALTMLISVPMVLAQGEGGIIVLLGASQGGQWLLSLLPLAAMALYGGLRLRFQHEINTEALKPAQFGIRQLMIFTAIIAVMLGIGRALLPWGLSQNMGGAPFRLFAFLVVSQTLMQLPLLCALFLEKKALLASMVSLLLIAVMTGLQWPLFLQILGRNPGPKPSDFVCINLFSTACVLLFGVTVRRSGYHFGFGQPPASRVA